MNKQRRQELYDVISFLDDAIDRLEEIKNDEQDSFDSLPENFQYSSTGDKMQDAMDKMDEIVNKIEDVKSNIEVMISEK
jgi:predicted  nucleic acid-binding Zn-ribbon protein